MPETIEVPIELWTELKKVLERRQFVSDSDGDEDNDYEVINVLAKMEEIK